MKRDPFCGTTTMRAVNQVAGPHGHKHRICHPVLSFCALFNPILSAMGRVADAAQPPPNGQLQLLCKIVARVVVLLPFQVCVQKGLLFHHPPRWLRWCLSFFFFLFWASKRKLSGWWRWRSIVITIGQVARSLIFFIGVCFCSRREFALGGKIFNCYLKRGLWYCFSLVEV